MRFFSAVRTPFVTGAVLAALAALAACGEGSLNPVQPADASADVAVADAGRDGPDLRTIVLASDQDYPHGIAVDDANVFFSCIDEGIKRVPKKGGALVLVATSDHGPHQVAVDTTHVYWADLGTGATDFHDGRVARAPKDAVGTATAEIISPVVPAVGAIILAGPYVYFTSLGTTSNGAYNNDGAIWRVPRAGGMAERLAKDQRRPIGLAVDDAYVYWTNSYEQAVARCSVAGCNESPTTLYTNLDVPRSLVVDEAFLYWSSTQGSNVVRAPKAGGGGVFEIASSRGFPDGLKLDRTELFWVESVTHAVVKMPRVGAVRPTELAADLKLPIAVAVDAESAFFTDEGARNVVRVPR
jgi:sugar lactone lactonase YvrE